MLRSARLNILESFSTFLWTKVKKVDVKRCIVDEFLSCNEGLLNESSQDFRVLKKWFQIQLSLACVLWYHDHLMRWSCLPQRDKVCRSSFLKHFHGSWFRELAFSSDMLQGFASFENSSTEMLQRYLRQVEFGCCCNRRVAFFNFFKNCELDLIWYFRKKDAERKCTMSLML